MKIALSLCGGGIKSAIHIGVLKAFEDNNIKFDIISGTSSGSIIATMYALNYDSNKMLEIFKKYANSINYFDFKNLSIFFKNLIMGNSYLIDGLNSGNKLINIIDQKIGKINISDLKIPIIIPAVNIKNEKIYIFTNYRMPNSNQIEYINDIKISNAIRASCSYPGIFSPFRFKNELLVDGGIVENLPWRETKEIGAKVVIGVVFVDKNPKKCCTSIFQVLDKSFSLLLHELSKYEWNGTDYLLKIPVNSNIGLLKYKKIDELFYIGYNETMKNIEKIKELII